MKALLRDVRAVYEQLRPGVYAPVYCDGCTIRRTHITTAENAVLIVHHHLLCPCGGRQTYIGPDFEEVIR